MEKESWSHKAGLSFKVTGKMIRYKDFLEQYTAQETYMKVIGKMANLKARGGISKLMVTFIKGVLAKGKNTVKDKLQLHKELTFTANGKMERKMDISKL